MKHETPEEAGERWKRNTERAFDSFAGLVKLILFWGLFIALVASAWP